MPTPRTDRRPARRRLRHRCRRQRPRRRQEPAGARLRGRLLRAGDVRRRRLELAARPQPGVRRHPPDLVAAADRVPRLPDAGQLARLPAPQPGAGLPGAVRRALRAAASTSGSAPRWSRWCRSAATVGRHHPAHRRRRRSASSGTRPWWSPTGTTGRRSRGRTMPGEFRGQVIHASAYKDPAQLRGRRVLVIGGGNTGCDIAVEAAQQAGTMWHSTRRGYWYAPKYVFGRPADQVNDRLLRWRLPLRLRQWLFRRTVRLTVGDITRFGLPEAGPPAVREPPDRQQPARRTTSATAGSPRCRTWPASTAPAVELTDGRADRTRPRHHRHRLPAELRVPRARAARHATTTAGPTCTCTRSPAGTPPSPWSGCCSPTPGCSRSRTGRAWRSPAGCGCAATDPERAAAVQRGVGPAGAPLVAPPGGGLARHWFEVEPHRLPARARRACCDELEPAS